MNDRLSSPAAAEGVAVVGWVKSAAHVAGSAAVRQMSTGGRVMSLAHVVGSLGVVAWRCRVFVLVITLHLG
jgi:hypothetical protein